MTYRSAQLWLSIGTVVLAPLFFGSVALFWTATWVIVLSLAGIAGVMLPMDSRQRQILTIFLCGCVLYALVAIVQVVPNILPGLKDSVWQEARSAFDIKSPDRISARAEIPPESLGHFLLFAAAFVNGFFVGTSRRSSVKLVSVAKYALLGYVIYGLAALVLTPGMLLWTTKTAYRDSLTTTFVNHNTAATFVGIGTILWFCETLVKAQSLRLASWRILLISRSTEDQAIRVLVHAAVTAICVFALFRTGSRAGLICSGLGIFVAAILIYANRPGNSLRRIILVTVGCLIGLVVLLYRTGDIANKGLFDANRWDVYATVIDAIRARPFLGHGLGSFPDVFPMFRRDDFYSWGVWDRAHSTILEIAFEMGVPLATLVAVSTMAMIAVLCRSAIHASERKNLLLAAVAGIVVAGVTHSLVDFSLQIPGYMVIFGVLAGCGLANAVRLPTSSPHSTSGTSASSPAQLTSDSIPLPTTVTTVSN